MAFSVFISFNGNCRKAVTFYAKAFGQELPRFMTYEDIPQGTQQMVDDASKKRIMYAGLNIGGAEVMFCDVPLSMEFIHGNNISPVVKYTAQEELRAVFSRLAEGGRVEMALQKTFWSNLYGMVTDQFGITWQIGLDDGFQMG